MARLATFLVILALRTLFYRRKRIDRSGTWGCGFTQPTVKMQYTGSSYAASILEFFRHVAPVREHHRAIEGRFPGATSYHSHVEDVAERNASRLLIRPVMALFDRLERRGQAQGHEAAPGTQGGRVRLPAPQHTCTQLPQHFAGIATATTSTSKGRPIRQ